MPPQSGARGIFISLRLCVFSPLYLSYPLFTATSPLLLLPESVRTLFFYPRACPRCPQLWGNVRRLPPATLLAKYTVLAGSHAHAQSTKHKGTRRAETPDTHTDTLGFAASHTHHTMKEISLVRGCMASIFFFFLLFSGHGATSLAQCGSR